MLVLEPEENFAVPLSLNRGRFYHPMKLRFGDSWHGSAHINNTHSLRTSSTPTISPNNYQCTETTVILYSNHLMLLGFLSLFILVNRYLNVVLVYVSLMNIDTIYFDMFVEHSNTFFVECALEYFSSFLSFTC